jgi:AcrR family transcriptional regulator
MRPNGIIRQEVMMKNTTEQKIPPRERILAAAEELFYQEGIRGVGVEAIAARANTTKMCIYRHFESKDALVAEWLRLASEKYDNVLENLQARFEDSPKAQLMGWANFITDRLLAKDCRGCAFANSVAEIPDKDHPARQVIERHQVNLRQRLTQLCEQAGIEDPQTSVSELIFVVQGAQMAAQSSEDNHAIAEKLLKIVGRIIDK